MARTRKDSIPAASEAANASDGQQTLQKDRKKRESASDSGRRPRPAGPDTRKQLQLAARRLFINTLLLQGGTFRQIADQLKKQENAEERFGVTEAYDGAACFKDAQVSLKQVKDDELLSAEELHTLQVQRYGKLISKLWTPAVTNGDLFAVDRLLPTMRRFEELTGVQDLIAGKARPGASLTVTTQGGAQGDAAGGGTTIIEFRYGDAIGDARGDANTAEAKADKV